MWPESKREQYIVIALIVFMFVVVAITAFWSGLELTSEWACQAIGYETGRYDLWPEPQSICSQVRDVPFRSMRP